MLWIKVVEMKEPVDGLETSQSIRGRRFPNFEIHDAKIASALKRDHHELPLQEESQLEEQKAQMEDRFLRGRQIAFMIYEHFRATGACELVLDLSDLFPITIHLLFSVLLVVDSVCTDVTRHAR